MKLIKLGKKGQITIPKSILRAIGLSGEAPLLVETTSDGDIILRQVGVCPVELYTDERIREFEEQNMIPPDLEARINTFLT
jgi:AbrB family looped-hinge helix DNA binding protein